MVNVPDSRLPSVAPSGPNPRRLDTGMSPGAAAAPGQAMQQFGQQAQRASTDVGAMVLDIQNRVNATKVMEAENRVREEALRLTYDKSEGFLTLKGDAAVTRPNGNSLTSEYGEKLEKSVQTIEAGLGNDAQREAFRQRAMQIGTSFRGQTTQHELQEFKNYTASVAEGTIAIRQRELVLDARDPAKVREHTQMIVAAVGELGKLQGWAAVDIEQRARGVVSQAHRLVLDDAIEKGNLDFADLYRMRNKDAMDADDILSIEGKWNRTYDAHVAMGAADGVFDAMGSASSSFDQQMGVVGWLETGHIKDPAARLSARSPTGAMGKYQVMPGTAPEAARLAGETWDPARFDKDEAYQYKLASAYYAKQLQTFGSTPLAMAAYNAGPGMVQDWIDGTNKTGKNSSKLRLGRPGTDWSQWARQIPFKETRDYVTRGMGRLSAGAPPAASLGEAVTRLRSDPQLAGNPQRLALAEQRLKANWAIRDADKRDAEQAAMNDGIKHLLRTGGDIASVPPSVIDGMQPAQVLQLMDLSKRLVDGMDVTAPRDELALFELMADPQRLRNLTPADIAGMRPRLSREDYKALTTRYSVINGGGPSDPKLGTELRHEVVKRAVDNRLVSYGLQTSGKDADEKDVAREAAIRRTVNQAVDSEQRTLGRQLTDLETEKVVDRMFSTGVQFHPGRMFGGYDPNKVETENLFAMQVKDLPKSEAEAIRSELRAQGAIDSDANVLGVYYRRKALQYGGIQPLGGEGTQ